MEPHNASGRAKTLLQSVLGAAEASLLIDKRKVSAVAIALVANLLTEQYEPATCIAEVLYLTEAGTAAPIPAAEALATTDGQLPAAAQGSV